METRIYRVTVRGWFDNLSPATREALLTEADDHDVTRAGFTSQGTLTYDTHLRSFTLRYELRGRGAEAEDQVVEAARTPALAHLDTLGAGHRDLRVEATDMAEVCRR